MVTWWHGDMVTWWHDCSNAQTEQYNGHSQKSVRIDTVQGSVHTMSDLISISEAARELGISRPTLSRLIKAHGVETTKDRQRKLVRRIDCQELIQNEAKAGRLRVRTGTRTKEEPWMELYRELKRERDQLAEKNRALEAELGALKLLGARSDSGAHARQNLFTRLGKAWDAVVT